MSPLFALLLVPLVGALGLTTETASWQLINRGMQNAADSAALAAAANGGATFALEAAAVARRYGLQDGVDNTVITALDGQPCPGSAATNCYRVTITRHMPISLVRVVGYQGDVDLGGGRAKTVVATSVASGRGASTGYCLIGLGTGSDVIRINGGPSVNLGGCDMRANGELECNGVNSDNGVNYGDAGPGATSGCGAVRRDDQPTLVDPYANIVAPTHACDHGNSLQAPRTGPNKNEVDAAHQISGNQDWSSGRTFCGDVKLVGDVTVSGDSTLFIGNGRLDLAGHTLRTATGASLTIIFGGTDSSSGGGPGGGDYWHYPMSSEPGGALNYTAPAEGPYAGIAMFQDRNLDGAGNLLDFEYSGNRPAFNITGLIYLPNADLTISGAINHQTGGFACIGIVAQSIVVSGTGSIFADPTSECDRAGLILPGVPGSGQRQTLVQ